MKIGNDPAAIRDYAQAVEAMGYPHVLAFDHVVGANPDRPGGLEPLPPGRVSPGRRRSCPGAIMNLGQTLRRFTEEAGVSIK